MEDETLPAWSATPVPRHHDSVPRESWGPFRLLERVGSGGFGEVYRAWDPNLQREVAVKLLLAASGDSDEEYREILNEARALASLHHPNIVTIHGVERYDGQVGLWTDFVHGRTLAALLRVQGAFGPTEAALIGIEVCKAVSAVHRAGLLHRDIKAENIMREEGGRILLMDFGLSSRPQDAQPPSGTLPYMAPELFADAPASVATDIYAIGVVLFYLSTGRYPDREHKLLIDVRPDLPAGFARVVDTAIHSDPATRWSSAGQFLAALSETLRVQPGPRRRWLSIGVAFAVLICLAFGVYYFTNIRGKGATPDDDEYTKAQDLLVRYYKPQNTVAALDILNGILKRDPKSALAQAAIGRAWFQQYRIEHDPAQLAMAHQATDRALQLDPTLAPAYVTLAMIQTLQGHTALSMQAIKQALQIDSRSAEAYAAQAKVLDAQGRPDDAKAALDKAIDLAPDDWRWQVQLGNRLADNGDQTGAAAAYRRAIQVTPDNAVAYVDLGIVEMSRTQYADAASDLQKALALQPSFAVYNELGALLLLQGKYSEAANYIRKALESRPENRFLWGNLAYANQWSGDLAQARLAYAKAIALAERDRESMPHEPKLLAELGMYYASVNQPAKSVPLLRQAAVLAPQDPAVAYNVADAYEVLGLRDDALRWIARAVALGYSKEEIAHNPALNHLRSDPRFLAASAQTK